MKKAMSAKTGRTSDQFMLRLPEGVREKIADEARKNGRSMNAELVQRIEESFEAFSFAMRDQAYPEVSYVERDENTKNAESIITSIMSIIGLIPSLTKNDDPNFRSFVYGGIYVALARHIYNCFDIEIPPDFP